MNLNASQLHRNYTKLLKFTAAEPASNAVNATESLLDTTESCSAELTTAIAVESTKNDIMSGLEDLFKGSPAVSSMPSQVQQPQKEVKKEDILSLFGKVGCYILF